MVKGLDTILRRPPFNDEEVKALTRDLKRISFHGATDVGNVRGKNEDTYHFCETGRYGLIADGMGGAAAGEIASKIFADTAKKVFDGRQQWSETDSITLVQKTFRLANREILKHVMNFPQDQGMGCTAELLVLFKGGFVIGHVGDSRSYRLKNNHLTQLTKDHSLVQDMLDKKLITQEEARRHAKRNVILRAVGASEAITIDVIKGKGNDGDLFLLCSDGLTDMVDDDAILKILKDDHPLPGKPAALIDLAKAGGGKDNITVVTAQLLE